MEEMRSVSRVDPHPVTKNITIDNCHFLASDFRGFFFSGVTEKKYAIPVIYENVSSSFHHGSPAYDSLPDRSQARLTVCAVVVTRHASRLDDDDALRIVSVYTYASLVDDDSRTSSVLERMRHVRINAATSR